MQNLVLFWWAMRDSNPHWSGYEPPALTVKLMARMTLFWKLSRGTS